MMKRILTFLLAVVMVFLSLLAAAKLMTAAERPMWT